MSATAARGGGGIGARLSVMMFLEFFVWGAWFVTTGIYMTAHGMTGAIADAYSVGPLAAILSPFFLGMIADRYFATERVLGVMHLLGGTAIMAAPVVAASYGPRAFTGILLLHTLCYMPTLGLSNTVAFRHLASQERQFPFVRVFGTLGWIAAGFLVSQLLHADREPLPFYVAGGAAIGLGMYSFTLPHTPPIDRERSVSVRDILGLDALRLLRNPSFLVFIVSSFLVCIPLAAYFVHAPIFTGVVGFEHPGSVMTLGQASEIVFMLAMPAFFARLGVKWMMILGMLAWVVRYGLFAAAATDHIRWMVLAGIVLHGICYDFFFVTGQIYVDKRVPGGLRAQAQGLLVVMTQGLGMLVGVRIANEVVARYTPVRAPGAAASMADLNWQAIWLVPCLMAAAVAVVFGLVFRDDAAKEPAVTERA
jgi:nucleoside transporter